MKKLPLLLLAFAALSAHAADRPHGLVIHGGAGVIERKDLTPEIEAMLKKLADLQAQLDQARKQTGTSAVVAIEDALKALGLTPERLGELQTRLRDILVKGVADPKGSRQRLVSLLMSHGGLTQARAEKALEGLKDLIEIYANPEMPYYSKPRVEFIWNVSDYDRLARRAEWSADEGGDE